MVNSVAGQDYFVSKAIGYDTYHYSAKVIEDDDFRKIVAKKLKGVSGWKEDKGNNASKFNTSATGSMSYTSYTNSFGGEEFFKVGRSNSFIMWLTKKGVNEGFWDFRTDSEVSFRIDGSIDPVLWSESDIGLYSGHVIRFIKE